MGEAGKAMVPGADNKGGKPYGEMGMPDTVIPGAPGVRVDG